MRPGSSRKYLFTGLGDCHCRRIAGFFWIAVALYPYTMEANSSFICAGIHYHSSAGSSLVMLISQLCVSALFLHSQRDRTS